MGQLLENMDKMVDRMDIQEERRKTAEAMRQAGKAILGKKVHKNKKVKS